MVSDIQKSCESNKQVCVPFLTVTNYYYFALFSLPLRTHTHTHTERKLATWCFLSLKYFCMYFLITRIFSYTTTVQLSKSESSTWMQCYYLSQSQYSSVSSIVPIMSFIAIFSSPGLVQDHALPLVVTSLVSFTVDRSFV